MDNHLHKRIRLTSFQIIILGFIGIILLGSLLLMLPIATKERIITPFNKTLFTSTSAACVTGLVLKDTATYWSGFGQAVILILIQIGGLGVVTLALEFAVLSGRKISLMQRNTMKEAISAPKLGGIVRLTKFVLKMTLIFEIIGAFVMMPVFVKDFGLRGVWMAFFHSISAFCNAGFDLMGDGNYQFVSLISYMSNPLITISISFLIIIGGIGFITWEDIYTNKGNFKKYSMQSKVILVTTSLLIIIPSLFFFFLDFSEFPLKERILASFFQAVTPRTAGFNTVDFKIISDIGQALIIILMLIGGSPGSTAGGMKTTTLAVLVTNSFANFKREEDPKFFGRRIGKEIVSNASTIFVMYIGLFLGGAIIISLVEGLPIGLCLFETASAVGTVGLTMGITSKLGLISQFVLIILMFLGRVGGLTLIYATLSGTSKNLFKLPKGNITVG